MNDLSNVCQRIGEDLAEIARVLARFVCDFTDFVRATTAKVQALAKTAKLEVALKSAPPRVRHLARYSKKRRVRKKNINRALRDYEGGRS